RRADRRDDFLEMLQLHDALMRFRRRRIEREIDRVEAEQERNVRGVQPRSVGDEVSLAAVTRERVEQFGKIGVQGRLAVALHAEDPGGLGDRPEKIGESIERQLLLEDPRAVPRYGTEVARGVALSGGTECHVLWQAEQFVAPEPHLDRRNEIVESFRAPTAAMDCTLQARPVRQTGVFAAIAR